MTMEAAVGPLAVQAAAGDAEAFAEIIARHQSDVSRVAFVVCGDLDMAEEAVQSAWTVAWRRMNALRDPNRLRAWLVAIAANEARQVARRRRRHAELPLDAAGSLMASRASEPEPAAVVRLDLARALANLSADDRALLAMRYVAGLDSTEIAAVTGRSASGTRARLARLLERMRTELER